MGHALLPTGRRGLQGGCTAARCVVVTRADGTCVGVEVLDIIRGLLRLGGRVHQQGRVVAQDLHPALEIGRTGIDRGLGNAAHAAKIGRTELGHQLLFGVGGIAEEAQVGQGGAVEPRGVPHCVD